MSTLDATNTLTATITSTEDSTGVIPVNRGLGNLAFDSNVAEFCYYQKLSAGDNTIALPDGKAFQLYVKNIDPSLTLTVKYTPTGGVQQLSPLLAPGDVFLFWQAVTNVASGITALILNSSGTALVEYFIGG